MAQKNSKNELSTAQKVGIGFCLTAAAVTAAGAFFLYGSKEAAKNRKKVKGWMLKAKGEVLEKLEKAEAITEDEYKALVDTASKAYGTVKNATAGEVKDFQKEMQQHWVALQNSKALKKLVAPKAPVAKVAGKVASKKVAVKPVAKTPEVKAPAKVAPKKK